VHRMRQNVLRSRTDAVAFQLDIPPLAAGAVPVCVAALGMCPSCVIVVYYMLARTCISMARFLCIAVALALPAMSELRPTLRCDPRCTETRDMCS